MPAYSIQDIKINSGVSEENGTFKAFLDYPINIYYNVTGTNSHAGDLAGALIDITNNLKKLKK